MELISKISDFTPRDEGQSGNAGTESSQPAWKKRLFDPKRRRALIIIGGIAILVVASVLIYKLINAGKESTDDAIVDADVVALAPKVSGLVCSVPVVENQYVKEGDIVLKLDDREYLAKHKQAVADLESARALAAAAEAQVSVAEAAAKGNFAEAKANVRGSNQSVLATQAQIEQARATLRSRLVEYNLAQVNLARARTMGEQGVIPQQQLDRAMAEYNTARASMNGARANVDAMEEQLRRAEAQVNESQGRLAASLPVDQNIAIARSNFANQRGREKAAEAGLALAALNLEWTNIVAPQDGVISKIGSYPGSYLAAGQTIGQFVPLKKYVTANFKETQVGEMSPGQSARIKVDSYRREIKGKVESLSGGTGARFSLFPPDNATGNFVKVTQRIPVRISLDYVPPDMNLRAGQSVVVTVLLNTSSAQP